jgi:hypothetical protein
VEAYNGAIRGFFKSFVADRMDLERRPFFKAAEGASEAPRVKF